MLERNKPQIFRCPAIETDSVKLDPRVRLKTFRFLPPADTQVSLHPAAPEHPAENERTLQTGRAEKETLGGCNMQVCNPSRDFQGIYCRKLRIPKRVNVRFGERPLADLEPEQPHSQSRDR
jgi:hypothetical protein